MIDEDGAGPHAGESACLTQHHRAQIGVIAHAGEDDVCAISGQPRRRGQRAAVFVHPPRGLARGAVVNRDPMPRPQQMPGHRRAHHAQADEGNGEWRDSVVTTNTHEDLQKNKT